MSRIGEWLGRGAGDDPEALRQRVVEALKQVYDPEIPVNIYDLGLIYELAIGDNGAIAIDMTLTTPGCPVAETFPGMVEFEVSKVEGVTSAAVEIVWDPPWTQDRMTEAAKLELGLW
jgi:FeS assembly SUF system protein